MGSLLQVRDLTVLFQISEKVLSPAVEGISFHIGPGEVVGLLGESGCGKTTAALSLLRLLPKTGCIVRGSVRFRGRELLTLDEYLLEKIRGGEISVVSQEPGIALNPVMRVGDQIADVIRAHRPWSRKRCREDAESLLALVRLSGRDRIYAAYPHQLSGGQRQRILIAQALACRPALVIADEPTAQLDATSQKEILALLRELKESLQIALLFISHNPGILAGLADRVMVMYAGRVVEEGSLVQVYRNPLHPYTRGLLRCIPKADGPSPTDHKKKLHSIAGSPPDPARLPPGCPFEPRCPDRMEACTTREPEEVQPEASRRVRCFIYGG